MMVVKKSSSRSSLRCKLQVIGARSVRTNQKGGLFIRCYLSAGNNTRIQLETREIMSSPSKNYSPILFWDEDFSLDCNGTEDSVTQLEQSAIIFELRLRKTTPIFQKIRGSQLIGRAEIPWKNVFEASETQTWVVMTPTKAGEDDLKPPALQVAATVEVAAELTVEEERRRRRRERLRRQSDECGCYGESCSCADNELLFVAEAFDAF